LGANGVDSTAGRDGSIVQSAVAGRDWRWGDCHGVWAVDHRRLRAALCPLHGLQEPTSPSIFNTGFTPSNGFAVEPVGVALIAFAIGVVLIAWTNRIARAIGSGVLIAFGVQTVLLFFGYVALAVFSTSAQVRPGGLVGVLAGFMLIAAGAASLASVFARDPARAI
jgi:hypothetical protein